MTLDAASWDALYLSLLVACTATIVALPIALWRATALAVAPRGVAALGVGGRLRWLQSRRSCLACEQLQLRQEEEGSPYVSAQDWRLSAAQAASGGTVPFLVPLAVLGALTLIAAVVGTLAAAAALRWPE